MFLGDKGSELADFLSLKFVSLSSFAIVRVCRENEKERKKEGMNRPIQHALSHFYSSHS